MEEKISSPYFDNNILKLLFQRRGSSNLDSTPCERHNRDEGRGMRRLARLEEHTHILVRMFIEVLSMSDKNLEVSNRAFKL